MSSTQPVSYVFLTDEQYITAFTFGLISCSLSLFGSTSIIYLVVKRHNIWNDAEQVHHRIVLGLSVMDVITSSIIFVAPYINREDTGLLFARGNVASCDFGGFFFQFFIGSTFYNCLLSIYFVRTIRYNKSGSAALFHHERLFHGIAFLVPIAFGIAGVVTKVFNPSLFLGFCDIDVYPWNCLQNDSNVQCERGGGAVDILNWPHSVLFMLLNFIGIVATWLVYWTIRQHARKVNRRWNPTSALDEAQRKRIRAVGIQAICYTTVFFVAFASTLFLTVVRELYEPETTDASYLSGEPVVYASILLIYILFPVQGFLNWLIYIRPRLIRWKDANAEKSWLWAYRQVLKGDPAPITERTSHLSTAEGPLTTSNMTATTTNFNSTTTHPDVPSSLSTPSLPPVSEELDDNQGRTATLSLSQLLSNNSNSNSRNVPPETSRAFRPAAERRFSGYCIQLPPNLAQADEVCLKSQSNVDRLIPRGRRAVSYNRWNNNRHNLERQVKLVFTRDNIFDNGCRLHEKVLTGIVKDYASVEEAAHHIPDIAQDTYLWCFYGNYYDYFIGYDPTHLPGPWRPNDLIPVIQEAQRMLTQLDQDYEQLEQKQKQTKGQALEPANAKDGLKPKPFNYWGQGRK